MTVGPGETATFDLRDMTTWQLREDWDGIEYAVDYSGSAFEVSLDGSIVTVIGADRAVPGSEEAAIVSVHQPPAVAPVRLILRVGAAPSTLPQGGSVTQQCSQAAGIVVLDPGHRRRRRGEPAAADAARGRRRARRPAHAPASPSSVASATSVIADMDPDAPGATCTATFSVRDAQGRRTNAERDGRLLLDLLGYPQAPASIVADRVRRRHADAPRRSRGGAPGVPGAHGLRHPLERPGSSPSAPRTARAR